MAEPTYHFDTLKIHAGYNPADHNYAVSVPIYQTAAYELGSVARSDDLFSFNSEDSVYTRLSNPTITILEKRIAELHGATGAIALASGMAAVSYALLNVVGGSGRILTTPRLYGGTIDSFGQVYKEFGIEVDLVEDSDSVDSFEKAIRADTKAIFVESITNPNATVTDLEPVADLAHKYNIPLLVDNTVATPYLLNPFDYGADIIVYSATKALTGHGNAIAGLVVENNQFNWANGKFPQFEEKLYSLRDIDDRQRSVLEVFSKIPFTGRIRALYLNYLGAALSPFNAYLVLIGLETLSERIEKQVSNSKKVIRFLENRREVLWIKHPEAKENPYRDLAKKYLPKGSGGIFSFGLSGTAEQRRNFIEGVKVFSYQANIGDARSLIINPSRTTHTELDEEQQRLADIVPETIRLSIGLENAEDLIADLDQAFELAFQK
ncbi:O-acetylhomoserine aminocarboxypropyltransferase/cysteine synthase family protein [Scatolibacter rhodanostii]|uniref:O-acetylhomoserine aminocarboxypropyltransferase/cysteine synthase family protein n=1 Tax=Scatolibacter rhodanostii TaxID=2014781 RepID=UPI000C06AE60|nr:aminotransferase class I/II-fold pyridoxal phosphate-dependent enzyme [Scatolibacter rhodanostii]